MGSRELQLGQNWDKGLPVLEMARIMSSMQLWFFYSLPTLTTVAQKEPAGTGRDRLPGPWQPRDPFSSQSARRLQKDRA